MAGIISGVEGKERFLLVCASGELILGAGETKGTLSSDQPLITFNFLTTDLVVLLFFLWVARSVFHLQETVRITLGSNLLDPLPSTVASYTPAVRLTF